MNYGSREIICVHLGMIDQGVTVLEIVQEIVSYPS